jgi:uncharacterized protein (TIGR01619 family)
MGMKNHEEQWSFYCSTFKDKDATFYIDLGLVEIAPIEEMPHLICVTLRMNDPDDDGLSTPTEQRALVRIENKLVRSLKDEHDIIYVGRLTADGKRSFYFYASETAHIEKTISETLVGYPEHHYDFEIKDDSEWDCYFSCVYPEFNELEYILSRRTIDLLEDCDDDLTMGKEVNHWIYFKSKKDREKFIERVTEKGFKIESTDTIPQYDKKFKYSLIISRIDDMERDVADDLTISLWSLADELGGRYDGWEASVEGG